MAYIDYLQHHGILGQKWGKRNGPPYPLGGGDYTQSEKAAIYKERKKKNSIYNKKHFDKVISGKRNTLSTLSYDKDRTKDTDMFYATYENIDKHQYNAMFNRKMPQTVYDDAGNAIGTSLCFKFKINNKVNGDMKVASEDSAAETFRQLYKKDRDFYNFVTDESRMQSYFVSDKYKFRGYRESRKALENLRKGKQTPSADDLQKIYRMFNYVLPYDGQGSDNRGGHDVYTQRTKFFNQLKKQGYGAVLDTNDAIYGGFKARAPVIVFDMEKVVPKDTYRIKTSDKMYSNLVTAGKMLLKL